MVVANNIHQGSDIILIMVGSMQEGMAQANYCPGCCSNLPNPLQGPRSKHVSTRPLWEDEEEVWDVGSQVSKHAVSDLRVRVM